MRSNVSRNVERRAGMEAHSLAGPAGDQGGHGRLTKTRHQPAHSAVRLII